ncbi:dimethylsulfonioproprionate lyase family protein [Puniceibacterium sediminis]|uniref:Dimethylsulfoniopropionate lyase DddL n=1 Tax=Puniceibacterium sediminis TaxID=1608407 RepID=A0A238VIT6_9RHOB|nr:dimethylsulfonioproprionate lyase family protein [Puniceibacterium sediminis]SNR34091.1 dimethylsulfoniopropionate lyase DddL [Puniceibacterium sediminis]
MSDPDKPALRLQDCPDWVYLLQEFDSLYRYGSAGGSKSIRSHRKRVRDTLSSVIDRNPEMTFRAPAIKPVTAHLGRALDLAERNTLAGLGRALSRVTDQLTWEYGYETMPKVLERKYAYFEVLGPQGPIKAERLILGFVLFAPNTTYPQHSHKEIEESYISVAGAWSENDGAVYAPGSLILNSPGHEHRITTGELDPCLLAYAWVGSEDRLSAPGMKLSYKRKARMTRS